MSFFSETELFRRFDGAKSGEFRVAFLCLHVVSCSAFLAGAACSAFCLAAGPRQPLSLKTLGSVTVCLCHTDGIGADLAMESGVSYIDGVISRFPLSQLFHRF